MYIKQVHIVNFRSLNVVINNLDPVHIFDELPELDKRDYIDAIRFVLDPNYVEDFRDECTHGYVQLCLALHETDVRPAVFLLCENERQREVFVKRYINEDTIFDVDLDGIGGQPRLTIDNFHTLWYGKVPVTSSKINLLNLGQSMCKQFFCFALNHIDRADFMDEWKLRFDDNHHAIQIVRHLINNLERIAESMVEHDALRVTKARRIQPQLEASLERYKDELQGLPIDPAEIHEANIRLLHLLVDKSGLKCKLQEHQKPLRINEEMAHYDAQIANVEFRLEQFALNLQIPEITFNEINSNMIGASQTFETFYAHKDTHNEIQLRMHTLAMHLLQSYCSKQDDENFNRMIIEILNNKIAETNSLYNKLKVWRQYVIEQNDTIGRIKNELTANVETSKNNDIELKTLHDNLVMLDQESFKLETQLGAARVFPTGELNVDIYQKTMFQVFDSHTLFAYETFVDVLSDVRTNPEILRDFVGFTIDFISFKKEFNHLADKVQFALRDILLNAIFKTNSSVVSLLKIFEHQHPRIANYRMISMERYRSVKLPLGLPLQPQHGICLLTDFMNPITSGVVQQLLEEFIVIDTDAYTVEEAVNIFRRNVICARTGCYQFYGDPNLCLGLSCGELDVNHVTVFDLFAEQAGRAEILDKVHEWEQNRLKIDKDRLLLQEKINQMDLTLKRNNFQRLLILYDLLGYTIVYFIQKQLFSDIFADFKILKSTIKTFQQVIEKDGVCDSQTILQYSSTLAETDVQVMTNAAILEREGLQSVIELHQTLTDVQLVKIPHKFAHDLINLKVRMEHSKSAFIEDSVTLIHTANEDTVKLQSLQMEIVQLKQNLDRSNVLQKAIRKIKQTLNKSHVEEQQLADIVDFELYENLSDKIIDERLRKLQTTEASDTKSMLNRNKQVTKCMNRLVSDGKFIRLLVNTLMSANSHRSLVQYNNLSSVVRAMNTLVPMVHRMGSKEFQNATIQLFLIYDDEAVSRCTLEGTIELDERKIRAFEIVVHSSKSKNEISIGRYENRCMALLWHLASCIASKHQLGVILLHELIDMFSIDQRSQIVYALASCDQLSQCQAIVVPK